LSYARLDAYARTEEGREVEMGLRFRKSFGIGKILRVNLGLRGVSLSGGVKGARLSIGKRGLRGSVGVPGSGLSWTSSVGGARARGTRAASRPAMSDASTVTWKSVGTAATWFGGVLTLACVFLVGGYKSGMLALIGGSVLALWRSRVSAGKHALESAVAAQEAQAVDQQRWESLASTFGVESATKIWHQQPWLGETVNEAIASFGQPDAVADDVTRAKRITVFKYGRLPGNNRWRFRLTFENSVVVGWAFA